MKPLVILVLSTTLFMFTCGAFSQQVAEPVTTGIVQIDAARLPEPEHTMILGAAHAGSRVVGIGDHGLVMLSDDDGKSFHQAVHVPTRATLNSVAFVDDKHGWAVGHWGVILATEDGGENWKLQRDDLTVDQPLFSVWFKDKQNGLAVGLFSLALATHDGGKTWGRVELPKLPDNKKMDTNLFAIFTDRLGAILIAGEQGYVFRSDDGGKQWKVLITGNKGTLWAGLGLDDGALIVAGLRGKILRSDDKGEKWSVVPSGTKSSITSLTKLTDGRIFGTALDGVTILSNDQGHTFTATQSADATPLTAALPRATGNPIIFSTAGVSSGEKTQ